MMGSNFSTLLVLIALLVASCTDRTPNMAAPNIVIILADDLGYGDIKGYNQHSKIPTPNLDSMVSAGIKFTDAHTPSSVCTPTRYGLLTGRYAWRTELKQSVLWSWDRPLIQGDRLTMPRLLKSKGYHTACIGKWHLGWWWPDQEGAYINQDIVIGDYGLEGRHLLHQKIDFSKKIGGGPLAAGFDYYFGDDVPNFPPYAYFENNRLTAIPDTIKPETMFGTPGPMKSGWDLTKVMPTITDRAVQYIREKSEEENPFFLYFALTAPHTPIAPSPEFIGKSEAGAYGDFVHQVDHTVGQIISALKTQGQWENTLLIFTSDNGSAHRDGTNMGGKVGSIRDLGHFPSGILRGTKADIWEGGHRVPFIASWPAKIKPKITTDQLFCLTDLMATISTLVGVKSDLQSCVDSKDFADVFLKNSQEPIRSSLVHHSIRGMYAVRKDDWKFIDGLGSGGWSKDSTDYAGGQIPKGQLYDLSSDPSEKNNVYFDYPEIVQDLKQELQQIKDLE